MDLMTIYADEYTYISSLLNELGVTFNQSLLLNYIDLAWRAIAKYQWIDVNYDTIATDKAKYIPLIQELAIAYFNNAQQRNSIVKGEEQITQHSVGSVSMTYKSNTIEIDSNGLTKEVKAAMPMRKLRLIK